MKDTSYCSNNILIILIKLNTVIVQHRFLYSPLMLWLDFL